MDSSQNYADLLEPKMRKKKKKLAQGEMTTYDPDKAREAETKAKAATMSDRMKKIGKKGY